MLHAPLQQTKQKLHLEFGGYSSAGVKASNEDAFTAVMPVKHSVRKYKGAVACIADGASCSNNAQIASQTAATNFASDYYSTPDFWTVQQSASKVIGSINAWLYQQGIQNQARADGYITTFSAIIVKSNTAHILHAGDSRVYLIRDNQLELLTKDHSYQRGNERYLTRALGIENRLELDYQSLKVTVGDRFLLTTDGVHDAIDHKQLESLAIQNEFDLESQAKHIGQVALECGSDDNISCLIIDVASLPVEGFEEVYKDLTQLTIPPALQSGNTLDQFEITRILHNGTRSHVYLARDTIQDTQCVLKVPSINFAEDLAYLDAFAREQWIGRKLSHTKIMKVLSPPQGTRFLYHVCEYLEGKTLRQWMIDNTRPNLDQIRNLLDEMISTVRVLHRDKMIHRDLKPENFIIDRDDRITLIDFGTIQISGVKEINCLNLDQVPAGDIGYIAPEYLTQGVASNQSDLFSIASIVYELIAGTPPFNVIKSNRYPPNTLDQWHYTPLTSFTGLPDGIPDWVDNVLRKALAPNPVNRYKVMSEFQSDFKQPGQNILNSTRHRPLIERNPVRFWQILSVLLLFVIIWQWATLF